jgi:hypothetical protein
VTNGADPAKLTDVPDFKPGLSMIHSFEIEVNPDSLPVDGPLIVNETIKVPDNTRAVQIAVVAAKIEVPTDAGDHALGLSSVSFEILKHPITLTLPRELHFEFKAVPAWKPASAWKGRFKLEFVCFG